MTTADRVLADLQAAYSLQSKGNGKYRANSPLRPGSNSHALSLTIKDGEYGPWYDHVAGEGGSLYELADLMGIDHPKGGSTCSAPTSKIAYADLTAYAQAHGAPVDVFHTAGWAERTTHQGRPALPFTTATGIRYRFIDGAPKPKPTYMSPSGYQRSWYRLTQAALMAEATGQPLVICNGEASTVAAQYYEVAATAITGGGENGIPEALVKELQTAYSGPILIALDCDQTGRDGAAKMLVTLYSAGYNVRAVDLAGGVTGFDIADFCRLHGTGAAAALPALADIAALPQAQSRLIAADDLHTLPPTRYLIQGIIATNMLHQMFAPGGTGKSFIALDMALCVAQYAPVVYLAGEAIEAYKDRVDAWKFHHNKSASNLVFWNGPIKLADPADVQSFITEVQTVRPALIVVDTLATCMVGLEESSTGDMTIAVDSLNTIRKATAAGVLVVHHTGWSEDHERGNSTLRAACRLVMKLTNSDGLIKLSSAKQNNGAEFEPRCFRLSSTPIGVDNTPVPVPARDVFQIDSKLTQKQIAVLQTLSMAQFKDGASHTQICEDTQLGKSTVNRAINTLLTRRLIEASEGRNKVYSILPSGTEELEYAAAREAAPVEFGASDGVNWQINIDALVPQDAEQARNNSGTSPDSGASYTRPSSAVVPPLQAEVPPSSAVVPPDPELLVPCSVPSPPLKGEWMEQQAEETKEDEERRLPKGDFYHDPRRIKDARKHMLEGNFKAARSVAGLVSGRKEQLEVLAEIEQAQARLGGA